MLRFLFSLLLLVPGLVAAESAVPPERVPAWILQVPASVGDILVADTGNATMYRFTNEDGDIVEVDKRYMSIGRNGPGKQRAWDRRTPLGVYFIVDSLDTSKLHDKYGVAAYPLDYPNAWDRANQRTGDGIWLHGVDHNNPDRPERDTDGCLSIPNEELVRLVDQLQPLITPVIVARGMRWITTDEREELRLELSAAVERWRNSRQQDDASHYMNTYADDFRPQGLTREEWAVYRTNVFRATGPQAVSISDLLLIADPETPGLFLSRFTEVVNTESGAVTTKRRLYWQRSESGQWRIVAEGSG